MSDPAFLFYTSDFLTGTMLMSNEHVGKYIRIMCYEHQHGRLTEEDMLKTCQTYVEHMDNENEDVNVNTNDNKKGVVRGKKFEQPTVEQISEYCSERSNKVNPQSFFDFYESKGWVVGNQKMKDWKTAYGRGNKEKYPPDIRTSQSRTLPELSTIKSFWRSSR